MKRIVSSLFLILIAVLLIAVIRAALLKPPAFSVPSATPVALDDKGAVQRFIGAIQIPTESKSGGQPPDQAAMLKMRNYLQQNFPRVHSGMQREVLADGALLFTWKGRDTSLKPGILMGHMDVVPVPAEALPLWKHSPYSGDLAEGFIWGRGTFDDKIHVLSLLEAAETLLGRGFVPARTILFAFGDDEENGGKYGAQQIVKLLQQRNVQPEFVIDEGGAIISGVVAGLTQPVALIGTSEKGYLDVALSTVGKGGHSSAPPPHTAVGELSAALAKLEDHQFPSSLPGPVRSQYAVLAPYMPFSKRLALANVWLFKPLLVQLGLQNPTQAGSFRTTTAEDMFNAGFKENALPPSARAIINFRILPGETIASVLERVRKVVDDPGVKVEDANPGSSRNPSPASPLDSLGYRTLETTIHQLFPNAIVTPNLLNAATDSGYYTVLTPNVYRFLAVDLDPSALELAHGLNERMAPEKYIKTVQFTAQLMQNMR